MTDTFIDATPPPPSGAFNWLITIYYIGEISGGPAPKVGRVTVAPFKTSSGYLPGDDARLRLVNLGVIRPKAELVVAEIVRDAACTAAHTARANAHVIGLSDAELEVFDACDAEAQRVRDRLLDAED